MKCTQTKFLIFIVGKTNSGKDTIANYIKEKFGIDSICSYTTRPKRDYEVDGVQHYFVDDETMDSLEKQDNIIAWTKNDETGIRYCATTDCMKSDVAVYIINPDGIEWFNTNGADVKYKSIYIELDEDIIKDRALKRGDNMKVLDERLSSERAEFDAFRDSKKYDYIIDTNKDMEEMFSCVDSIMNEILN